MSDRRTLTSSLSTDVVGWLLHQGYAQFEVARLLGVSESFISLVKSRERGLTLDHIESLADALRMPVGEMFITIGHWRNPARRDDPTAQRIEKIMRLADKSIASLPKPAPARAKRAS